MSIANGSTEYIQTELSEGVLHIQFNRPDKKNALTRDMYQTLGEVIAQAEGDKAVRVMLITGDEQNFTSGNDIANFQNSAAGEPSFAAKYFFPALSQAQKPVIAAVNGVAIGVGTTMLLHCDLVYAGQGARFRMPFVNLGICPEFGSSFLLPRMMGHQRAAELLLLGDFFDAATAHEIGLVNAVCLDVEVLPTALDKARQLASQPPASLRLTKSLLKAAYKANVAEVMEQENMHLRERTKSPEMAEVLAAFAQGRKPDFSSYE